MCNAFRTSTRAEHPTSLVRGALVPSGLHGHAYPSGHSPILTTQPSPGSRLGGELDTRSYSGFVLVVFAIVMERTGVATEAHRVAAAEHLLIEVTPLSHIIHNGQISLGNTRSGSLFEHQLHHHQFILYTVTGGRSGTHAS